MDEYKRERLHPQPHDWLYLHLHDLRLLLESNQTDSHLKILDYGCGSSPYQTLFPNADYKRADFLDVGNLDYRLDTNSRVPEADAQFDLILSTQVLEHVPQPEIYLSECFRLLKPGGKLLLSTHGTYEDHGCPHDLYRWTAEGLDLALSKAGFQNIRVQKLTTGPRAVLFLMGTNLDLFQAKNKRALVILLGWYRWLFLRFRVRIHMTADVQFAHCCVVPASEPGHKLYMCVAALTERPV